MTILPRSLCLLWISGAILLWFPVQALTAQPFTMGNLLVTRGSTLYEYSRAGQRIQSIPVSPPQAGDYEARDTVYDRYGNVHIVNFSLFQDNYISTYEPATDTLRHTPAPVFHTGGSEGDLSIWSDYLFRIGLRMHVLTRAIETFDVGLFGGTSETSVGRDGLLYSVEDGFPSDHMQRTDPVSLSNLGSPIELRKPGGSALHVWGVTTTADGDIYAADFDGTFYHFSSSGQYLAERPSGTERLVDINLAPDGTLVSGTIHGEVVITNVDFSTLSRFKVGDGTTYVAFVAPPVPEPSTLALVATAFLGLLIGFLRGQPGVGGRR